MTKPRIRWSVRILALAVIACAVPLLHAAGERGDGAEKPPPSKRLAPTVAIKCYHAALEGGVYGKKDGDTPIRPIPGVSKLIVSISALTPSRSEHETELPYEGPLTVSGLLVKRRGAQAAVPWSADLVISGGHLDLVAGITPELDDEQGGAVALFVGEDGVSVRLAEQAVEAPTMDGWLSLLPPLLAIVLALLFRQVVPAILCGIWAGAALVADSDPLVGALRVFDRYLLNAAADSSHMSIILFSLMLGGMVAMITRSGGTQGMVDVISRFASGRRSGQLATWATGLFIFFDDYANTLLVGNTMRPYTDKLRISREKLAFIVDATAAPVAGIALVSTWIGFEVGLIDEAAKAANLGDQMGYELFLASIPYRFYTIFCLGFVFLVGLWARDFGPMLTAERRSLWLGKRHRDGAQLMSDPHMAELALPEHLPRRWYNAMIPIVVVILATLGGIVATGLRSDDVPAWKLAQAEGALGWLRLVFGAGDAYASLLWGSAAGCAAAAFLALTQRLMTLDETIQAWLSGLRSMMLAAVILTMAWALGAVCRDVNTAGYIISAIGDRVPPMYLPVIIFAVAGAVAFATGTSWATMTVLFPLAVPLAAHTLSEAGVSLAAISAHPVLLSTVAAVLAGALFGDHCSPISDTTVMSSMAAACDHVDHVRTQFPYALVCALAAAGLGFLPIAAGWYDGYGVHPAWLALGAGFLALTALLVIFGRNAAKHEASASARSEGSWPDPGSAGER